MDWGESKGHGKVLFSALTWGMLNTRVKRKKPRQRNVSECRIRSEAEGSGVELMGKGPDTVRGRCGNFKLSDVTELGWLFCKRGNRVSAPLRAQRKLCKGWHTPFNMLTVKQGTQFWLMKLNRIWRVKPPLLLHGPNANWACTVAEYLRLQVKRMY